MVGRRRKLRPDEWRLAAELSPAERRRARQAIFRGRAAENPAAARFAIVAARAAQRQLTIGPWFTGVLVVLMGALLAGAATELRRDDAWIAAAFAIGGALSIALGIAILVAYRRVPAGIEANLQLLTPEDRDRLATSEHVRPTAPEAPIFEFLFVAAGMTGVRQLFDDEPLSSSILGALIFAVLLVGVPATWKTIQARRARPR